MKRWVWWLAWAWALVLCCCGVRLVLLPVMNSAGISANDRRDFGQAVRWFDRGTVLNPFQRWIAPYNRGVAHFGDRDWVGAATGFRQALALAPESQRCRVTLNLVWTLEAQGDELKQNKNLTDAQTQWGEAREILQRSQCPQQDPPEQQQNKDQKKDQGQQQQQGPTDERLEQKQRQAERQPDKPQQPDQEKQLEQRKQRAAENRQRGGENRKGSGGKQQQPSW